MNNCTFWQMLNHLIDRQLVRPSSNGLKNSLRWRSVWPLGNNMEALTSEDNKYEWKLVEVIFIVINYKKSFYIHLCYKIVFIYGKVHHHRVNGGDVATASYSLFVSLTQLSCDSAFIRHFKDDVMYIFSKTHHDDKYCIGEVW